MKNYYIWHNTRGITDEYWIIDKETSMVSFKIPRWLGRLLKRKEHKP